MALSASCVRMGGLRLALAMMLALLVVPGYVVAPVLFAKLDTHTAGMVAGAVFHVSNLGVLLLGAAVAAFWMRLGATTWGLWTVLAVMLVLVCINAFVMAPVMQDLKDAAGNISALPADDAQRKQFGMLHGISEVVHMLASLLALWLVATGGRSQTS